MAGLGQFFRDHVGGDKGFQARKDRGRKMVYPYRSGAGQQNVGSRQGCAGHPRDFAACLTAS